MDAGIVVGTEHWILNLAGRHVLIDDIAIRTDRTTVLFLLSDPNFYYLELDWKFT